MKKNILCILLIVILIIETSCRSVSPNAVSGGGVSGDAVSGGEISITFEDASGKKQELNAGEVDTKDMGAKMCVIEQDGFAMDDHFYYMGYEWIVSDKGKKIIDNDLLDGTTILACICPMMVFWCKYGEKLYFVSDNIEGTSGDYPLLQFASQDLNSWKERIIDASEYYKELPDDAYGGMIDNVFVYHDKIYIEDSFASDYFPSGQLKEFDMNGKQLRTFFLKNSGEEKENIIILGIMDEKIYFCTWKDSRHILKSKDMVTGEVKKVMQYEQPAYNRKEWSYMRPYFYLSGNNLFVEEYFCDAESFRKRNWDDVKGKSVMYCLPIKNGGKMKRVLVQDDMGAYDVYGNNIYYIDNKYFLHRNNIKTGTDKIISKRKAEDVICTKEGLFVFKYRGELGEDEDEFPEDYGDVEIYYMDFDGKNEKKVFD